jgi:hypothetical protein
MLLRSLQKYQRYSRREVHDIFSPDTEFTPQRGTWGLQGIVRIEPGQSNFVFFVTFGQHAVEHTFDESISERGILTWQSQPSQTFRSKVIQELIHHDHLVNQIYLFLRQSPKEDYLYLGQLAYLTHDREREAPVHFKWQVLDWDLSTEEANRIGLQVVPDEDNGYLQTASGLRQTPIPSTTIQRSKGEDTRTFRGRHVNFAENEAANKKLGILGELAVIEHEKEFLLNSGRADLANKIRHVSNIEGDGAGYDILSFNPDGSPKHIEVKTTRGGAGTPFMITPNELAFAKRHSDSFYLYRLYEFNPMLKSGKFFVLQGDINEKLFLTPTQYKAHI